MVFYLLTAIILFNGHIQGARDTFATEAQCNKALAQVKQDAVAHNVSDGYFKCERIELGKLS